jgi:hypothetical protein
MTDWPLMGASEYKHVVLGSILLSYVEDAIDVRRIGKLVDLISGTGGKTFWACLRVFLGLCASAGPRAASASTHISPSTSCSWRYWSP